MSQAAMAWLVLAALSGAPTVLPEAEPPEPTEATPAPTEPTPYPNEATPEPTTLEPDATPEAPAASPPPPPTDPSPPELSGPIAPEAPEVPEYPAYRFDDWQRRGVLVALGVGVAGCGRAMCEGFKAGGHGGFEMGYRFGIVAPVASVSAGGGRGGVSDDLRAGGWDPAKSAVTLIDVGVGALLFPVRNGRFDPYLGARIGATWFAQSIDYTGDDFGSQGASARLTVRRGAVRLVGGFDVFIRPVFSIGPRFEVALPFAGRVCISGDVVGFPDDQSCMKVQAAGDADMVAIPLDTRDLPLSWSFSLLARLVLPAPPKPLR